MRINNDLSVVWEAIVSGIHRDPMNERCWTLSNDITWMGTFGRNSKLYNRQCYDDIIENINKMSAVLVLGTSGIGKSFFLLRFLVHIVETARSTDSNIPSIKYLRWLDSSVESLWLKADGSIEIYDRARHGLPMYALSDSVDMQVLTGTVMSLEVASDTDNASDSFSKRVDERRELGLDWVMPLFSFDELLCIKPAEMSQNEAQFRYEIFGGSARSFLSIASQRNTFTVPPMIEEAMLWFFGDHTRDQFPILWPNIINVIAVQFAKSNLKSSAEVLADGFFKHKDESRNLIWASKFMGILAGLMNDRSDREYLTDFRNILGRSEISILFESVSHRNLTISNQVNQLIPLWVGKGSRSKLMVDFRSTVALIRTVEDIGGLFDHIYALPCVSNFPLVDAVVQPDTLIQFTVTSSHRGSVESLAEIRSYLREKNQAKHKLVFIVPKENLKIFRHQSALGAIKQYISTNEYIVTTEKRKRL